VKKRRNRPRPHPGPPTAPFTEPNAIWSADYKGQFKMKNGRYCYPLTVQDGFSRYLLACQPVDGTTYDAARQVFTRLFREFGMPRRIRTDNGSPFSSALALGRLSRLSVWWVRLGILPDFTEPASPQQNGRHERMHKDLKADACIPSAGNRAAQQRRFNAFRDDFNHIRPHEALDQKPPASSYQPSSRSFPTKIPPLEYPAHFETRKVSANGGIRWHSEWSNVSHLLGGEYIGLEEVALGVWAVYFGPVFLGWLHIEKGAIIDDDGSRSRNPRL
jgi:putative transposase